MIRERASIEGLERGVVGTKKTLDKMHVLVAKGKLDPTIQKIATWIRLGVPEDQRASGKPVADAVFYFVRKHGLFQRDPFQIEKIEHPISAMQPIIQARAAGTYKGPALFVGDCDTISGVYLASLLGVLGFHYAWETAKVDASRPDEFSHVWTAVQIKGEWYPLDPSTNGTRPGWRPPVPPNLFARWPEKPIDSVGGVGMSAFNGNGKSNGTWIEKWVPQDEYGVSIQRRIGNGPMQVPDPSSSDLQLLPPRDSETPMADLDTDIKFIKKVRRSTPSFRVGPSGEQPDDHGPPYYRGEEPQPQYKIEQYSYPVGSPWLKRKDFDNAAYRGRPTRYYRSEVPASPERKVEVEMSDQPFRVRPELITLQPKMVPAGVSQSTYEDVFGVEYGSGEAVKAAEEASTSVWDTITSTIEAALPAAAAVGTEYIKGKYATALANATSRVAGAPATPPITVRPPAAETPWYKSPFVWIGGALVVGGIAYVATRS